MSFASGSSQSAIANGCGYGYGCQLTSIAEVQGSATENKIYRLLTNPPCSPPWQTRCGAMLTAVDVQYLAAQCQMSRRSSLGPH